MQVATEITTFTCICCPLGCRLEVSFGEDGAGGGGGQHRALRGAAYAVRESHGARAHGDGGSPRWRAGSNPSSVKTAVPRAEGARGRRAAPPCADLRALPPVAAGDVLLADVVRHRRGRGGHQERQVGTPGSPARGGECAGFLPLGYPAAAPSGTALLGDGALGARPCPLTFRLEQVQQLLTRMHVELLVDVLHVREPPCSSKAAAPLADVGLRTALRQVSEYLFSRADRPFAAAGAGGRSPRTRFPPVRTRRPPPASAPCRRGRAARRGTRTGRSVPARRRTRSDFPKRRAGKRPLLPGCLPGTPRKLERSLACADADGDRDEPALGRTR